MRPDSVNKFSLFYLGSFFINIVATVIYKDALAAGIAAEIGRQPGSSASMLEGAETTILWAGTALELALALLLWVMIVKNRLGLVRYIIALWTGWKLLQLPVIIAALPAFIAMIELFELLLLVASIYYLFQAETTIWLRGKKVVDDDEAGKTATADPE